MRGKKILNFSIIAISFTVLMLAFVAVTPSVFAAPCFITITAPTSIQATVDANPGKVICLDDSGGDFSQQVIFDAADSGITLTALHGTSPVLDGTGVGASTTNSAITLLGGVSGVTIQGLEIRDYLGDGGGSDRSSGIVAASGTTSGISIKNNHIHDNFWNGVLVFSAGDFVHNDWKVKNNLVEDNDFIGIELTNTGDSLVTNNVVDDNVFAGILVQARNTVANSGSFTHPGAVQVMRNTVSDSDRCIYILSLASGPLDPFDPIVGAQSSLSGVQVKNNDISDCREGIRLLGFSGGTLSNTKIHSNTIVTNTDTSAIGIRVTTLGAGGLTEKSDIHHNDVTSAGDFAVTLEAGTDQNKVRQNTLLATNSGDTGNDAVDDSGTNNQIFKNK